MDIEVFLHIRSYYIDTICLRWSELCAKAAVWIDFKVEIVLGITDREEKFKATVFIYRRKRLSVFGTNVLFHSTEMNKECLIGIT